MDDKLSKRNFFIAEVLACITFILNSICVITAERGIAEMTPVWQTHFGVIIYWPKSILAIAGLWFFFSSKVFVTKETPRYRAIMTLLLLWYSVPIANMILVILSLGIFKIIQGGGYFEYEDRIPLVVIWLLPASIIALDIFKKVFKIGKKSQTT